MSGRLTNCSPHKPTCGLWLCGVVTIGLIACTSLESRQQTVPEAADQSRDDQNEADELAAIAAELRSIREQAARTEEEQAGREAQQGPIDWPSWLMVIITGGAVLVALRTLRSIERQAVASAKSADAAMKGAGIAEQTLRLAHRPYFDVKELTVGEAVRGGGAEPPYLVVSYKVYNASQNPAPLTQVETGHWIDTRLHAVTSTHVVEVTISPGRGYPFPIIVDLDAEQDRLYKAGRLMIHVAYTVSFSDPFGSEFQQTINRVVLCGPRFRNSYLSDLTLTDEGPPPQQSKPVQDEDLKNPAGG